MCFCAFRIETEDRSRVILNGKTATAEHLQEIGTRDNLNLFKHRATENNPAYRVALERKPDSAILYFYVDVSERLSRG